MVLTTQLSRQVAGDVQRRGRHYYQRGAVHLLEGDEWSVRALVQGTEQYQVTLTGENRRLRVWCTCPYYQDRVQPCKHIWATLLAAEARGFLRGASATGRLRLVDDADTFAEREDGNGLGAGRDEREETNGRKARLVSYGDASPYSQRPPRQPRRRPRKSAQDSAWKKHLAGLRGEM